MTPIKRPAHCKLFHSICYSVSQEIPRNKFFEQKIQSLKEYGENPQYGIYFEVITGTGFDVIEWYLDENLCRTPEDYLEMSRHPLMEIRDAVLMLSGCSNEVLFNSVKTSEFPVSAERVFKDLGRFDNNPSFNSMEYKYLVAKAAIFSRGVSRKVIPEYYKTLREPQS
jgi:hypothetical protein